MARQQWRGQDQYLFLVERGLALSGSSLATPIQGEGCYECHRTVGTYAKIVSSPRPKTSPKNFKDLLKKVNTFNDADFTARKLLSNSWDAYVVNNLSFKISDKSFLWILQLFHQLCLQLFFSPSGRLAFVGGAVNVFLGVTSVIFGFPM